MERRHQKFIYDERGSPINVDVILFAYILDMMLHECMISHVRFLSVTHRAHRHSIYAYYTHTFMSNTHYYDLREVLKIFAVMLSWFSYALSRTQYLIPFCVLNSELFALLDFVSFFCFYYCTAWDAALYVECLILYKWALLYCVCILTLLCIMK